MFEENSKLDKLCSAGNALVDTTVTGFGIFDWFNQRFPDKPVDCHIFGLKFPHAPADPPKYFCTQLVNGV